jgi:hypothetical protein
VARKHVPVNHVVDCQPRHHNANQFVPHTCEDEMPGAGLLRKSSSRLCAIAGPVDIRLRHFHHALEHECRAMHVDSMQAMLLAGLVAATAAHDAERCKTRTERCSRLLLVPENTGTLRRVEHLSRAQRRRHLPLDGAEMTNLVSSGVHHDVATGGHRGHDGPVGRRS